MRPVRIAIDVRKLNDYGVGTYVRNLVEQLALLDHDTEYVLMCKPDDLEFAQRLGQNFRAMVDAKGNLLLETGRDVMG